MIDLAYIKKHDLIIFEVISGSKAYGLDNPNSDTDIKGVFILPKDNFYGLNYIPQVSDAKNDVVYYEIGRFVDLLIKGNPTIIELISSPVNCVRIKDNIMNNFNPTDYLSKECKDRFAGYAMSQIKKAKGLKKKIYNPVPEERKTILDFCYIPQNNDTISLSVYLELNGFSQVNCGLKKIPHMQNVYGLYHDLDSNYNGIAKSDISNEISLSSIPKGMNQKTILYFNKDGYSYYCKSYKEYWEWVKNRNEDRFENTLSHGKNYDSKNMMHTFRLLRMANEIGKEKKVNVFRKDRDELLSIKAGEFDYDVLLENAEQLMHDINDSFAKSSLPENTNKKALLAILVNIRKEYYK